MRTRILSIEAASASKRSFHLPLAVFLIECFTKRAEADAEIKISIPREFVRNRKSRPDNSETAVIRETLFSTSCSRGQVFTAVAESKGRPAFRTVVPMYYSASCLQCHGIPKGETDVTGYPKEDASEGDLRGLIQHYALPLTRRAVRGMER